MPVRARQVKRSPGCWHRSKQILLNRHAIAVGQDALGQMGIRLSGPDDTQVWARKLANGDVAVALYNRGDMEVRCRPPRRRPLRCHSGWHAACEARRLPPCSRPLSPAVAE